jgi:RNA polymerase sigma-70 factor, ECF subfamily
MSEAEEIERLLERAAAHDADAVDGLLLRYRKRIKRMVRLRLSRRLQGRVDDSDIVQDAYLEAAKRLGDYLHDRPLPFFLWLRHLTGGTRRGHGLDIQPRWTSAGHCQPATS